MQLDLDVITSEDYFAKVWKEIDWDENDKTKPSIAEADLVQSILTTEVSIFLLSRTAWAGWILADYMVAIRRWFINQYEASYSEYIEYNDFY